MIEKIENLITILNKLDSMKNDMESAANLIAKAFKQGNKILLCGNGGSAAEAQHIAAEYVSSLRHEMKRNALPALALTTDTSFITARGNDYGFDEIFERQLEAFGKSGDVLIGISTSGNSKNVVKAISKAKETGMKVIGLTGESGGVMKEMCDVIFRVPSKETMRIQECHLFIEHTIVGLVEQKLFGFAL